MVKNSIETLENLDICNIQDHLFELKNKRVSDVISGQHDQALLEQYNDFIDNYVEHVFFHVRGMDGVAFDTISDRACLNVTKNEAIRRLRLHLDRQETEKSHIYNSDKELSVMIFFPFPVRLGDIGLQKLKTHLAYASSKIKQDTGLDVEDLDVSWITDPTDMESIFYENVFRTNVLLELLGIRQTFIPDLGNA